MPPQPSDARRSEKCLLAANSCSFREISVSSGQYFGFHLVGFRPSSVVIGWPSFGCLLPIIGSVVEISDFGPRIFLRGWTAYVQPPVAKCEPEMIYEN